MRLTGQCSICDHKDFHHYENGKCKSEGCRCPGYKPEKNISRNDMIAMGDKERAERTRLLHPDIPDDADRWYFVE